MLNLIFVISTVIIVSESMAPPERQTPISPAKGDYNMPYKQRMVDQESMAPPGRQTPISPAKGDYNMPYKQRMVDQESNCGENEIYDSCPPIYPPLRCNVKEMLTVCGINPEPGSPLCEPGCRCADNYYLNASGDCITKEECLYGVSIKKCNSRSPGYSDCINGGCMKWRCTDYGYVCTLKGPCEVGCACEDDYKRSPSGSCMPADPCPPMDEKQTPEEMTYPTMPSMPKPKPKPQPFYKPYAQFSKSDMGETLF